MRIIHEAVNSKLEHRVLNDAVVEVQSGTEFVRHFVSTGSATCSLDSSRNGSTGQKYISKMRLLVSSPCHVRWIMFLVKDLPVFLSYMEFFQ